MKDAKGSKTMYLVRMYYTDSSESYSDGNIRFNVNDATYIIPEDKETWVPQEVLHAADLTERDVYVTERVEDTGRVIMKIVRRKRVAYEVLDKKRVKEDYEVDIMHKHDVSGIDIEVDDEVVTI